MAQGRGPDEYGFVGALNERFGVPGAVRFKTRLGGPVVILEGGGGSAIVALDGAQVLSFAPEGEAEVLWLSPFVKLGTGRPVRGGIPVCWPWFGPHPGGPALPAHGFVRASRWDVADVRPPAGGAGPSVTLSFTADPSLGSVWSHHVRARVTVTVGSSLGVALETINDDDAAITISAALHTYLAVGDIGAVTISGLKGRTFIDQLGGLSPGCEHSVIKIDREIDRIYQDTDDAVVVDDRHKGRRLHVAKRGSQSTVIWNPWVAKAERLGDVGPDGYRRMVCVEAANAGKNSVTLAPGARHQLETMLRVERYKPEPSA